MEGLEFLSIELILVALILVTMLFALITGLIQGIKKNMYNLVWTIIFWVGFYFTADLVNLDLICYNETLFGFVKEPLTGVLSGVGIDISGDYKTLMEAIIGGGAGFFAQYGIDINAIAPEALNQLVSIVLAILNSIFKIVYLIVYAIVAWILKGLIYLIFFKAVCTEPTSGDLRRAEKQEEKYEKKHKGKRNKRLLAEIRRTKNQIANKPLVHKLGGLTGLCRGAISSFLILCLVNSVFSILPEVNKQAADFSADVDIVDQPQEEQKTYSLYDFIIDYTGNDPTVTWAVNLVKDYKQSALVKTTQFEINGKKADDMFIDLIISGTSQDFTFSIVDELQTFVQIAEEAYELTNGFNMESVNWLALNENQVAKLSNVLNLLAEDDFITGLLTSGIAVALSLDQVTSLLPEGYVINQDDYKNINWKNEIKALSGVVTDFYSLGDITNADYLNLDADKVKSLFNNISQLQSINFIGHVGAAIGLGMVKDSMPELAGSLDSISNKLANMIFTDDIKSYGEMYAKFKEIVAEKAKDGYYNEDGSLNYLYYFTSFDLTKFSPIFDTLFETTFLTELMPDVMTIAKSYIPNEYATIINPSVTSASAWKNEINSILTILASVTNYGNSPWQDITKFDFSVLSGFSSESICKSDLLSYAVITLFVQASNSEGILSSLGEGIGSYIMVPDTLKTLNEETHKYATKWYGTVTGDKATDYKDGELYIMFNTITKCLSKVSSIDGILKDIPDILNQINSTDILTSDVLYFSISAALSGDLLKDTVSVPETCLTSSGDYKFNDKTLDNVVKKDEIKSILDIVTDGKTLNLRKLYKYSDTEGKYDADGVLMENPTEQQIEEAKARVITNPSKAMLKDNSVTAEFNLELSAITSLFTDKDFYDEDEADENKKFENVENLFKSEILRATASSFITGASDMIYIPDSSAIATRKIVGTNEDGTHQYEDIKVIKSSEFSSLVAAINEIDIDLDTITGGELTNIIGVFADENDVLKPALRKTLGQNGYDSKYYSGILHGTISKVLLDYASDSSGALVLQVPSAAMETTNENLIQPAEVCDLVQAVLYIGTSLLDESSNNSIIDTALSKIILHKDALNSIIFRATITGFIADTITIDQAACYETLPEVDTIAGIKMFYKNDINDLLAALDEIRKTNGEDSKFSDIINDITGMTVGSLVSADTPATGETYGAISKAKLFRAILGGYITSITIPEDAKTNDIIQEVEVSSLIKTLGTLLGTETTINNLGDSITDLKFGKLKEAKSDIAVSKILNTTITEKLADVDAIIIPDLAYETDTNNSRITQSEMEYTLDAVVDIVGADTSINNVGSAISDLKIGSLSTAKASIKGSLIMNSTITKKVTEVDGIYSPDQAFVSGSNKGRLTDSELDNFIDAIVGILGSESTITSIGDSISNLTLGTLDDSSSNIAGSYIMNATVTKKLKDNGGDALKIPSDAYKSSSEASIESLKNAEIESLLSAIATMFGNDTGITSIATEIGNFTLGKLQDAKSDISASMIMNATVTSKLEENSSSGIVIPTESYKDDEATVKQLNNDQMEVFIDVIVNLLGSSTSVSNLGSSLDNLTLGKLDDNSNNIATSYILNATVTSKIKSSGGASLKVPSTSYKTGISKESLKNDEIQALLGAIATMFGATTNITEIATQIENFTLGKLQEAKTDIGNSKIMNATVTNKLEGNASTGLIIPDESYQDKNADDKQLVVSQLGSFIDAIVGLLGGETSVSGLGSSLDTLTLGKLDDSSNDIATSYILNATVTSKIKTNAGSELKIPAAAYKPTSEVSKESLKNAEITNLLGAISTMFGSTTVITGIASKLSDFTLGKLQDAKTDISASMIMNATVTSKLEANSSSGLIIPAYSYQAGTDPAKQILVDQLEGFIDTICTLLGTDASITTVGSAVSNLTFGSLDNAKNGVSSSFILNATVTSKIVGNSSIVIPIESYEDETYDRLSTGNTGEMVTFIGAVVGLVGQTTAVTGVGDAITNLKFKALKDNSSNLASSYILSCTITNKITASGGLEIPVASFNNTASGIARLASDELTNFIDAIVILAGEDAGLSTIGTAVSSIMNINDDQCKLFNLADSEYLDVCASIILAVNARNKIVDATGPEGFLKVGLALNTKVAKGTDTQEDYEAKTNTIANINSNYTYTTITVGTTSSDVCDVLLSLKKLKANGLLDSLTKTDSATSAAGINTFKSDAFVETMCDATILRDSLPGVINNFNTRFNKSTFNTGLDVPTLSDDRINTPTKSINYWKASKNETGITVSDVTYHWTNGELYHFMDFIVSSADLASNPTTNSIEQNVADLNAMLASDIAHDTIDTYYTAATFVNTVNAAAKVKDPTHYALVNYIDPTTIDVVSGTSDRDWSSASGQAYLTKIAKFLRGFVDPLD